MGNLLIVATSILSSGVIAAIISFSFAEAKERWLQKRAKIEETYLSATAWLTAIFAQYLLALGVCRGQLTYDQMNDQIIKSHERNPDIGLDFRRMKMNIFMYERSLIPLLNQVEFERDQAATLINAIRDCYNETGDATDFLVSFKRQLNAFDAASRNFQTALVERGVMIGAEKAQSLKPFIVVQSAISSGAASFSAASKRFWSRVMYRDSASS